MQHSSKIYVAGHAGLVGSALIKTLQGKGYHNIVTRAVYELDLRRQSAVELFFEQEQPEYVFLAAAKVGGILANETYKAEFLYDNLTIATNVIHAAHRSGVKKLINLGSSCIYPKYAPQPLKEEYLLSGPLEPTNEPYAVAKIAAIKLCRYYHEQYGANFFSVMPTNLYGPGDNFNLETSHVVPALIRKFHLAKLLSAGKMAEVERDLLMYPVGFEVQAATWVDLLGQLGVTKAGVTLWGSGTPYREFLYVDDLAQALIFLMQNHSYRDVGELLNIGAGVDIQITDLAQIVKKVVGFKGAIHWDSTKPDGTPRKLLDVARINKLGWQARVSLEEGLFSAYAAYKNPTTLVHNIVAQAEKRM
ncbi:GDP-L-fucose synthase [Candidatus Babeliales bacterium]|nr:GDP-L-fucose synthase [Candidatus Babeliales bacterium]